MRKSISRFFYSLAIMVFFVPVSSEAQKSQKPTRTEIIQPIHKASFDKQGTCQTKQQGGNPRNVSDCLVFDGSTDGHLQVDPQIAVGGEHVLHGTNTGLYIYSKQGEFVNGVSQACFNHGIDPKLFYDGHNQVFGFDLWDPWDKAKKKPVNISVSESNDPTGAWNTYPVPAPQGRDGGAIGYSRKWIGYSFPGGPEQTFVLKTDEAKAGKPVTVYHFAGSLGHPVLTQDPTDDLYFVNLTNKNIEITRVRAGSKGIPVARKMVSAPHHFKHFGWPPKSPQKGTDQGVASGDRNPKNIVLQNRSLWFSHTVNVDGRAAVQWHQVKLNGTFVQSGLISDPKKSYLQTTIAVNRHLDVLVGFQEASPETYVSPCLAYRRANDRPGTLRPIIQLGQGQGANAGGPWGDYSGSVVDGDNLVELWTVQSITDPEGNGDTVIARLPAELLRRSIDKRAADSNK